MTRTFRAVVVDDHPLVARATKSILDEMEGVSVVGVAGTGRKCIELVEQYEPDLVLLDYQLPDMYGSHAAERIKLKYPRTHIVIFTGIEVTDLYNQLLDIGVSGIISKESDEMMICHMVRCLMDDIAIVPVSILHQMRLLRPEPVEPEPELEEVDITGDEALIMMMVVKGSTHEQIAEQIHVSKRSVDNYLKRIYDRLNVKTRAQAIEKFVKSRYYADASKEE